MQHDHVLKKFFDLLTASPLITVTLIYMHLVIMAYSEKLSDIIVFEKCEVYSTKKQYSFCISLNLRQKGP